MTFFGQRNGLSITEGIMFKWKPLLKVTLLEWEEKGINKETSVIKSQYYKSEFFFFEKENMFAKAGKIDPFLSHGSYRSMLH